MDINDLRQQEIDARDLSEECQGSATISLSLHGSKRLYTYQCARPIEVGDRVNVKLPGGEIVTEIVREVHDSPQLSDKWETKWAVLIQTKAEYEAEQASQANASSFLGKELGL